MQLFHVTISDRQRRPLARDDAALRRVVRALAEAARDRLVLFGLPEDHLHAVMRAWSAGLLARDLRGRLGNVLPDLELKQPHVEVVDGEGHLRHLASYQLGQVGRHRVDAHPASFTGSCFPDLIGARLLPGFLPTQLGAEVPGLRLRELFPLVGLDPEPLVPASDEALRWIGVGRLADLAASVYALPADLSGSSAAITQARALAAGLARRLKLRLSDLAQVLRVTRQAVTTLSLRPRDARGEEAIRRRLALEERVRHGGVRLTLGSLGSG